jgi:hypothetical protein
MNIERTYRTTATPDDLAAALADHFRAEEFEVQIFHASEHILAMQARKENAWRHIFGIAYAATVLFTASDEQLSIALVEREWADTAMGGVIGLVVLPPALFTTAYGIWKENQMDSEIWRIIEERTGRADQSAPMGMAGNAELVQAHSSQ